MENLGKAAPLYRKNFMLKGVNAPLTGCRIFLICFVCFVFHNGVLCPCNSFFKYICFCNCAILIVVIGLHFLWQIVSYWFFIKTLLWCPSHCFSYKTSPFYTLFFCKFNCSVIWAVNSATKRFMFSNFIIGNNAAKRTSDFVSAFFVATGLWLQ